MACQRAIGPEPHPNFIEVFDPAALGDGYGTVERAGEGGAATTTGTTSPRNVAAVGGRLLRVEEVAEDGAERPHQPLRKLHVTLDTLVCISPAAPRRIAPTARCRRASL